MASGAGKAAQPPGPGSAVNGTAAEFANIEQELYDYQMHSKMCKKIAQLTKVRPAGDIGRGAPPPDAPPLNASPADWMIRWLPLKHDYTEEATWDHVVIDALYLQTSEHTYQNIKIDQLQINQGVEK